MATRFRKLREPLTLIYWGRGGEKGGTKKQFGIISDLINLLRDGGGEGGNKEQFKIHSDLLWGAGGGRKGGERGKGY